MLVNFNLEGLEEKDVREIKYLLQTINDTLEGSLTTRNIANFMNTYVINEKDSLDASHPMYVHFNIIDEMVNIISVKVSFWILNYRAYSTPATSSGGGVGSDIDIGSAATDRATWVSDYTLVNKNNPANGSGTITSVEIWANENLSNCEVATFYVVSGNNLSTRDTEAIGSVTAGSKQTFGVNLDVEAGDYLGIYYTAGKMEVDTSGDIGVWLKSGDNIPCINTAFSYDSRIIMSLYGTGTQESVDHTHDINYGIHQETNSPTIKFYISDTGEDNYSDTFFGGYITDKANIDITDYITTVGSKMIRFTSTTRTRLSVQIEVKLAITAR